MSGPASPWVLRAHPWSLPLFYLCSLRGVFPCFPLLWACTRHDASVATGPLPAVVTGHGAAVCCLPTTSTPAARGGIGGRFGYCEGSFPPAIPLAV